MPVQSEVPLQMRGTFNTMLEALHSRFEETEMRLAMISLSNKPDKDKIVREGVAIVRPHSSFLTE